MHDDTVGEPILRPFDRKWRQKVAGSQVKCQLYAGVITLAAQHNKNSWGKVESEKLAPSAH